MFENTFAIFVSVLWLTVCGFCLGAVISSTELAEVIRAVRHLKAFSSFQELCLISWGSCVRFLGSIGQVDAQVVRPEGGGQMPAAARCQPINGLELRRGHYSNMIFFPLLGLRFRIALAFPS